MCIPAIKQFHKSGKPAGPKNIRVCAEVSRQVCPGVFTIMSLNVEDMMGILDNPPPPTQAGTCILRILDTNHAETEQETTT